MPYLFVKSRAELGEASGTKRPTSVVLVTKALGGKKGQDAKAEDKEEWDDAWKGLRDIVVAATKTMKK